MTTDPGREKPIPEEELAREDDKIIGTAFRWSLFVIAVAAVALAVGYWLTREQPMVADVVEREAVEAPPALDQTAPGTPRVVFTDVTRRSGVNFVHVNGAAGEKLLPETMGAGVAFLDYDADGDQDLLFVNSNHWEPVRGAQPTMALYRNDGGGTFSDVTTASGLGITAYGQGVAVGDYDNDGFVDVFLSTLGLNRLFKNEAGRFREVSSHAGVSGAADAWSSSAGFFDFDNDGDLDLFVCNYVQWSREIDLRLDFTLNGVDRAYGPPKQYAGTHSNLYRNDGGGAFTDVSGGSGIRVSNPATGAPMGKALAVTFADADEDGYQDIFVANDTVQNFVFHNRGDGTFDEIGAASGIGFDGMGNATGAMGIDTGPLTDDGRLGVGIGNFANEATSFYVQQERIWQFVDLAGASGVGSPSRLKLSFGLFFFDYDLDGRLDLLQVNGHLEEEINEIQPSQHYRQPAQFFWNCARDRTPCFAAVAEDELGDLARPIVGRAAAYADIDGDGDLDVVMTQAGGAPLLLRNDQRSGHHWLRVTLIGAGANRDAIGARIELRAAGVLRHRRVMPTRSYLSQTELPVTFGLGDATRVDSLTVRWPGGGAQEVPVPEVDTAIVVTQLE